jgi:hypothetical protein
MRQLLDIPYNVPTYQEIEVGDLIVSFNSGFANDRSTPCHCHLLQVLEKESRYGKFYVKTVGCYCEIEEYNCNKAHQSELNYSDMTKYTSSYRMVTKAVQVLFGDANGNTKA